MAVVAIRELVSKLRCCTEADFLHIDRIRELLRTSPVDPKSIEQYLIWDAQHYTRNLIEKTPLFELLAICWETGQGSSIHNHKEQNCWMAVPIGRLLVQNYRVSAQDLAQGTCDLVPSDVIEMNPASPAAQGGMSEDWLAVWIGLLVFTLSLGLLFGADLLGWAVKTSVWMVPAKALAPVSKNFSTWPGITSLLATFGFLLLILALGARAMRTNAVRFAGGVTVIFAVSYACWFLGSWAYIAATPDTRAAFKIGWSLNLTNESGYILALLAGLVFGNLMPRLVQKFKDAIRPELFIKSGFVMLGGFLGITALGQRKFASVMQFQGLCAIACAYLIFWPIVYYVARRYFRFSREWAAPLASGISICGVSAAIATGSAIKARPQVPVMVSSLVVIFSVVELLILPFAAQHYLFGQPMVAGAWMGLAVKTDGAAVASAAIADAFVHAKAVSAGMHFQPGWTLNVATTV